MSDTAGRRGSVRRDPARGTWTVVVDASDIGAATRRQVRTAPTSCGSGLPPGDGYLDQGWVFAQLDGAPLHPTRFRRELVRRVAALGLPPIRLHDLRHTWASLALRAGVNPKIVQERIGHASVAITLDLYTHTDRAQHTAAAEAVTRLFWADAR